MSVLVKIASWQDMQAITYSDDYHCEHFLIDAYAFLTGRNLANKLLSGGHFAVYQLRNFKKITMPRQHCIVLLRDKNKAHVGVWHDNQILHLVSSGVVLQPLEMAKRGFKRVDFYAVT